MKKKSNQWIGLLQWSCSLGLGWYRPSITLWLQLITWFGDWRRALLKFGCDFTRRWVSCGENLSPRSRCRLGYPSSVSPPSPPRTLCRSECLVAVAVNDQRPRQGLGGLFWVPSSPNRGTALCSEGALNHPELASVLSNQAVVVEADLCERHLLWGCGWISSC